MAINYPDNINVLKISNSNGREYWAYPLAPSRGGQDKPAMSISLPGGKPSDNSLMGLEGMTRSFSLTTRLWNDGEDRANGTAPQDGSFSDTDGDGTEDVITIEDQIDYLWNYFHSPDFSVGWTLEQKQGYVGKRLPDMDVHLETIDIPFFDPSNVLWVEVDMVFVVGENI